MNSVAATDYSLLDEALRALLNSVFGMPQMNECVQHGVFQKSA